MELSTVCISVLMTWNSVLWPMVRLFSILVPVVFCCWTAYQACLCIGSARISAEEVLAFSIQRVLAIIPFLATRVLMALIWPCFGTWANYLMSCFLGGDLPGGKPRPVMSGPRHGDRELWAWLAALALPPLVGLCAWLRSVRRFEDHIL